MFEIYPPGTTSKWNERVDFVLRHARIEENFAVMVYLVETFGNDEYKLKLVLRPK